MAKRPAPKTAFKPGQSGNPGGRPKGLVEVIEAARGHTQEAVARLAYWMRSDHPHASSAAAQALLDRGWGKPVQPQELSGKDGGPIQTQVVDDARVPLEAFLAEFGGAGKPEETKH